MDITPRLSIVVVLVAAMGCAQSPRPKSARKLPYWDLQTKDHPPTTNVELTFAAEHPRCVFRPASRKGPGRTFDEVRRLQKTDKTFAAIFDRALKIDLKRQHPAMLAAVWIVTGDDRYANAAVEKMLTQKLRKSGEPYYSNVWSHALAYDWLYHYPGFTAEKKKAVVAKIIERIGTELDGLDDQGMAVWHGRNQAANGVMISVLGIAEHLPKKTLRSATAHYVDALRALQYSEGWPEGASYWIYNRAGPYPLAADCVISATGKNTIDGIPIREVMRKIGLWQIYQYAPNGTFEPYGDSAGSLRLGGTGWWTLTADHYARLSRDPALMAGADYLRNRSPRPYGRRPYYWHVVLTYDPTVRPKSGYDPAKPELWMRRHLAQAMLFGRDSMGVAFFRGQWGDRDEVYASFKAGDLLAHHDHYDTGHFSIQAGGLLAPQTGLYGTGYWSDHRLGYAMQTVSANSLLVLAPGETVANLRGHRMKGKPSWKWASGGQRVIRPTGFHCVNVKHYFAQLHAGPHLDRATITAFESDPGDLDYVAADITTAYNSTKWAEPGAVAKASLVTRQFAYLRRERAFVVYDRVETTDPSFRPRWLLHHLAKPFTPNERLVTGKSRRNGIVEAGERVLVSRYKNGLLVHAVLLPVDAHIYKIGGPDYCCYVEKDGDGSKFDGVNLGIGRASYAKVRNTAQLGRWRTEIEPAHLSKTTRFLSVLAPLNAELADKGKQTAPQAALIDAGPLAHAARVGDTVAVFARDPRPLKEVTFTARAGERCIVFDAVPGGTYQVGRRKLTASKERVLRVDRLTKGGVTIRLVGP